MGVMCCRESIADLDVGQSNKFDGPSRILGSESGAESRQDMEDARKRAGEAAEARAKASSRSNKKLTSQLHQQKKQSRAALLGDASKNEMRAKAMDENLDLRKYQ